MIPKKIVLKNFLSYRTAELDFTGLHTACICGENGAGKSSLLEAISWAVWGKTRTSSDDDLIYLGEKSLRVDYEFIYNQDTYRIIRSRQKKRGSSLDFQILSQDNYQSLSGKTIRDTQNAIDNCLKIDYETFVNSAYLRQGRADEFMQNKPTKRKQILANLLKLEQYDSLATEAKDLAKDYKIRGEEINRQLAEQKVKVEQKQSIKVELDNTEKELQFYQQKEQSLNQELLKLQEVNTDRRSWEQRFNWINNNFNNTNQKITKLNQEQTNLTKELNNLDGVLARESEITTNFEQLKQLRIQEQEFAEKFTSYRKLTDQQNTLEKQLQQFTNNLSL